MRREALVPAAGVTSTPATADFAFQVQNTGNVEDTFEARITGTAGPVTASLVGFSGSSVQLISPLRIPPGAVAQIPATVTLNDLPQGTVTARALSLTDTAFFSQSTATIGIGSGFHSVTPCRIVDTRLAPGPWGGPVLSAGNGRAFVIGGQCGIPTTARAVAFNFTIDAPDAPGHLTIFPEGALPPLVSTMNFRPGQTRANNAIMPLGIGGAIVVLPGQPTGGTVHFVVDVTGYFD